MTDEQTEHEAVYRLDEAPHYKVLVGHHYEYAKSGAELDAIVRNAMNHNCSSDFLRIRLWLFGNEHSM